MKRVEYFNSTYELNNYYPNGVSNDVLAIVGDEDATVLFTSSNNKPMSGSIPTGESQGGYVPPEGYIFPQGYAYITANGDHDVSAYAYTNVDVPIPAGYIVPEGTYNITTNGSYSIAAYENVNVNVPIPAGYVIPTGTYNITANGTYVVSGFENAYVDVPGSNPIIPFYNYFTGNKGSYILTGYCVGADVEITYESTDYTCYVLGIGRAANYNENSYTFERYAYIIKDENNAIFNNIFKVGYIYTVNAKREFTYSSSPIAHAATIVGDNISNSVKETQIGGSATLNITDNGTFFAGHAKSVTVNIPKAADFYLYDTNSDERTALISNGETTEEEIDGNTVNCYVYSATVSKSSLSSGDTNYNRIIDTNKGYVLHFTYSESVKYQLEQGSERVYNGDVTALNRGNSTYAYDQLYWQIGTSSDDLYNCSIVFTLYVPVNLMDAGYKYKLHIQVTGSESPSE